MSYEIVFDIDDTIADLHTPFCNNLKPFLISPIDSSKIYDVEWMLSNIDPKYNINSYEDWYRFMGDYIITPEDFLNFKPIEGSLEFIRNLYIKGYNINFCSRIIYYKDYPEVKYQWLKKHLSDIEFDLMIVSKSSTKKLLNCKYVIDDSVTVAKEVSNVLVPVKPWNKEFLESNPEVFRFENFKELENLLW